MSLLSLAIETSGRNHAVALSADRKIVARSDANSFLHNVSDENGPPKPGSSSLLMPMIQAMFVEAGVKPSQIGLVSVTEGPGMFTGLRVGVVAAKTLAFALQCPLVSVNTLHACAMRSTLTHALDAGRIVKAVINAQRAQLFAASFRVDIAADGTAACTAVTTPSIVDPKEWFSTVESQDFLTGPGLKMTANLLEAAAVEMPSLAVEEDALRDCDVATVAAIGEQKFHNRELESPWDLQPIYFRPSAAEEVRAGKK